MRLSEVFLSAINISRMKHTFPSDTWPWGQLLTPSSGEEKGELGQPVALQGLGNLQELLPGLVSWISGAGRDFLDNLGFFFVNFGFFWTIFGFSFYNCGIFLTIWEFFGTILGFSAATNEPGRRVRAGPAPAPLVLNKSSLIPQNHGIIEAEKILWEHQTQPPTIPARPRTDPNPEGHSLGVFGATAPNRVWLFM